MIIKLKGWAFDPLEFPVCTAGRFSYAIDHEGYLLPCILIEELIKAIYGGDED